MVMGLPNINDIEFCKGCVLGKQSRTSFPIGKSWKASRHLELVHDDLCGPMNTESLNAYAFIKTSHHKLDKKSEKCIFIEYSLQSKAYWLYNPFSGKIIISRDVTFNEAATWPWSTNKDGKTILIPFDDETSTTNIEPISEPSSHAHSSPHSPKSPSSSSSSNSDASSSDSPPLTFRNLKDVYDSCQFALYVSNLIDYDEASKNQYNADGSIQKHKARLVAKGYSQEEGIDHEETFLPLLDLKHPTKQHLGAAKRILHYIAGTKNFGIWYTNVPDFKLIGFIDSDWAGCLDTHKSTSRNMFSLGSARQALWLRKLLVDFDCKQKGATEIFCDDRSLIPMAKNPAFHARTKHIDVQHHFNRHLVADNIIKLKFYATNIKEALKLRELVKLHKNDSELKNDLEYKNDNESESNYADKNDDELELEQFQDHVRFQEDEATAT
nr:uncharacterized mitochondrial protein AtMg00810-like [Tanacetum cinerariifolium]